MQYMTQFEHQQKNPKETSIDFGKMLWDFGRLSSDASRMLVGELVLKQTQM
jgi:hypothetical protein